METDVIWDRKWAARGLYTPATNTTSAVQWTEQQTSVNCFHVFFFRVAFSGEITGILHSRSSAHQMDRTKAPLFALELRPLIDILGSRPWGPQESNPLPLKPRVIAMNLKAVQEVSTKPRSSSTANKRRCILKILTYQFVHRELSNNFAHV